MNIVTHVSLNLFPIVMLLVIYLNNQKTATRRLDKREFDILTLLTIGLMLADIFSNGLAGNRQPGRNAGLWIAHMIYLFLSVVVASVWLIYIWCRTHLEGIAQGAVHSGIHRSVWGIDAVFAVIVLTTPWTNLIFSISEQGSYMDGRMPFLPYLISSAFLVAGMGVAGSAYRQEVSDERRTECRYLLYCGVGPLVGFILQHFLHDWWIGGPCLALAILFIYLNAQNRQMSTDSLTGLNNRREFDLQMQKIAESETQEDWGLLMMDVDDFKSINDTLGHAVGDDALWQTADILRHVFGKSRHFIARYGGDEFVVLGLWQDEDEVQEMIARMEQEIHRFNSTGKKPYQLSLSIGHALWRETKDSCSLVGKADERMYEKKCSKKRQRGTT